MEPLIKYHQNAHNLKISIQEQTKYIEKHLHGHSTDILDILDSEINKKIRQILPTRRNKRSIDAIGTLWKYIGGNLDQEDGKRINLALQTLEGNQLQIKRTINEQIKLASTITDEFKQALETLNKNQEKSNERIKTLTTAINQAQAVNMRHILITESIGLVAQSMQLLMHLLERIEKDITFARLRTISVSILEPGHLLGELKEIENYLNSTEHIKLPFKITLENVHTYEEISQVTAYTQHVTIVFVIKIPLTNPKIFTYYENYPLPIPYYNQFQILIPKSKYLLVNDHSHIESNSPCTKINNNQYLCELRETMNTEDTCETELLREQPPTQCQPLTIELKGLKIQNIDPNTWIIISNEKINSTLQCENTKTMNLQGTYILNLADQCKLYVSGRIIQHIKIKETVETWNLMPLPSVPEIQNKPINASFTMEHLDLHNIEKLQHTLALLPRDLKINELPHNIHIIHPIITPFFMTIIITIIIYITYRYCKKNKNKEINIIKPLDIENHTPFATFTA